MTPEEVFVKVRDFASRADPKLADVVFTPCGSVRTGMRGKARSRSFMHVGHVPGTVCFHLEMDKLPLNHIVGVILHEFGHIGSNGGEAEADAWVVAKLGITLEYKGKLCLEWVPDEVVRRVLAMPSRNPEGPMRKVVKVLSEDESAPDEEGERGAKTVRLRLSCGHSVERTVPSIKWKDKMPYSYTPTKAACDRCEDVRLEAEAVGSSTPMPCNRCAKERAPGHPLCADCLRLVGHDCLIGWPEAGLGPCETRV